MEMNWQVYCLTMHQRRSLEIQEQKKGAKYIISQHKFQHMQTIQILLANPEKLLKRHFINTNKEAQKMGLIINEAKTKFMEETMNLTNTQSVSKLVITRLKKCMNLNIQALLLPVTTILVLEMITDCKQPIVAILDLEINYGLNGPE